MTVNEAKTQLLVLRQVARQGDNERAHSLEDTFHKDVLRAIAAGSPNAVELAKLALSTKNIKFARWYA